MTYPNSADVTAGDATLASHYNNLRKDSIYLGQAAADSVPLGTLLERYETRLELEKLSTDKVRVPASASAPVSLLVDGFLCQAVANVDLGAGDVPSGAAAAYYVFANRAGSSTTFTLTVNTSSTESDNQRRIGRFYWDGSAVVKDSVRSEFAGFVKDILYFIDPQICDGRLTLSTGVPVPTSDVSSSAAVYFTPCLGDRVALYVNDYGWRLYSFDELTLDISGFTTGTNYDIWLYDNEGTLTLAATAWSNDILRATAITRQDGVYVKSGAPAYRYLGTIRTSGAGVSCDTLLKRFVWNFYNRSERPFEILFDTPYAYNTATWRQWNADSDYQVGFVIGVNEDPVFLISNQDAYRAGGQLALNSGIGLDKTDGYDGLAAYIDQADSIHNSGGGKFFEHAGIGYHYLALVEKPAGATTNFTTGSSGKTGANGYVKG